MSDIHALMGVSPVIPVVAMPEGADAVALGRALADGGVGIIEVTLRTPGAVAAIAALARDGALAVGAGTVWREDQARAVVDAGAEFIVTPGRSLSVWEVCRDTGVPLLPGAQTTSEIADWVARGLEAVKFFPAQYAGGIGALKSFAAVFAGLKFCPTGGVSAGNLADYLAVPAVACVGGSWLTPADDIAAGNWSAITGRCQEALKIASEVHG
ncbi:MAG: bifunctional 4-hydroxy-2-oxoglutarate aldolase/2-dehydro-3-deoxy-phosphogluconate aldolase [Pseudomonadota bacterium]